MNYLTWEFIEIIPAHFILQKQNTHTITTKYNAEI